MELNLEQAFDGPVDLSSRFEIPLSVLDRPELLSLGPVEFAGRLQRMESGFLLRGNLSFGGETACSRCLAPVPFERTQEVAWIFTPAHLRTASPEERELSGEELDVIFYDALSFPFDPFVEEQLQLEIPMKPLCREGCRGLCPRCGADLNVAPCACAEAPDGRWEALKDLLPDRN